jgi:hypothetical protein
VIVRKSQHPSAQATAEGFVTLFRSQTGKVRREVVLRLLEDDDLREDVEAALLWEERQHEKKRSFSEYLREYEARRS